MENLIVFGKVRKFAEIIGKYLEYSLKSPENPRKSSERVRVGSVSVQVSPNVQFKKTGSIKYTLFLIRTIL